MTIKTKALVGYASLGAPLVIISLFIWIKLESSPNKPLPDLSRGFFPTTFSSTDKRLQDELLALDRDGGLPLDLIQKASNPGRIPMEYGEFNAFMLREAGAFNKTAKTLDMKFGNGSQRIFLGTFTFPYLELELLAFLASEFAKTEGALMDRLKAESEALSRAHEFIKGRRLSSIPKDILSPDSSEDLSAVINIRAYLAFVCIPELAKGDMSAFRKYIAFKKELMEFSPIVYQRVCNSGDHSKNMLWDLFHSRPIGSAIFEDWFDGLRT